MSLSFLALSFEMHSRHGAETVEDDVADDEAFVVLPHVDSTEGLPCPLVCGVCM